MDTKQLEAYAVFEDGRNTLLIFRFDVQEPGQRLSMQTFDTVNRAIDEYDRLEKELGDKADIVFVRGETEERIRDAFRNTFRTLEPLLTWFKTDETVSCRLAKSKSHVRTDRALNSK